MKDENVKRATATHASFASFSGTYFGNVTVLVSDIYVVIETYSTSVE